MMATGTTMTTSSSQPVGSPDRTTRSAVDLLNRMGSRVLARVDHSR